jgi:hypothetical protein
MLTIQFDLALDDLLTIQAARARRRGLRLLWLALLGAGIAFLGARATGISFSGSLVTALSIAGLATASILWFYPAAQGFRIRREFIRHSTLRGPVSYTFTEADVTFATVGSELRLPWVTLTDAHEDEKFVYLDVGSAASYFIPKRAVRQEELERLRLFIASTFPAILSGRSA